MPNPIDALAAMYIDAWARWMSAGLTVWRAWGMI